MAVHDGLAVIHQYICAIHLCLCTKLLFRTNFLDPERAHRSYDHFLDVFSDLDFCWSLPATFSIDSILALDVSNLSAYF